MAYVIIQKSNKPKFRSLTQRLEDVQYFRKWNP